MAGRRGSPDLKAAYPAAPSRCRWGALAESYRHLRAAGADRYLLRHETATAAHYRQLHPAAMTLQRRMGACPTCERPGSPWAPASWWLPFQTTEHLAADLAFIRSFARVRHRAISAPSRHLAAEAPGTVELTCYLLSLVRLAHPTVLLPAHGLEALDPRSRERGILASANVVMPNLSPPERRAIMRRQQAPLSSADAARNGRPGGAA